MSDEPDRPLVTFAVFAYNQEKYIREAVEGAFAQTYEPLEIILSDDCSTDRTFEIMREMAEGYSGSKTVLLRKNTSNIGLTEHVNAICAIARGDYFIFAAGDDISLPSRTADTVDLFRRYPRSTSVSFNMTTIDQHGSIIGDYKPKGQFMREVEFTTADFFAFKIPVLGAARAIHRSLFDVFGALDAQCPVEDVPYLFRALLCGTVVHSQKKNVFYRTHNSNLSQLKNLSNLKAGEFGEQMKKDCNFLISENKNYKRTDQEIDSYMKEISLIRKIKSKVYDRKYIKMNEYWRFINSSCTSNSEKSWLLKMLCQSIRAQFNKKTYKNK